MSLPESTGTKIPTIEAPATVVAPVVLDSSLNTAQNIASSTTAEQDKKSKGQRYINAIWEVTQASIAVSVVLTTCLGVIVYRVFPKWGAWDGGVPGTVPFPPEWWTIVGLVIGFYFGRTNHSRIGDPK